MKFVCLKCGHVSDLRHEGWAINCAGNLVYNRKSKYLTCTNCLTRQPIRPIEAAIWIARGMPKITK
jgi:hypothetical protein